MAKPTTARWTALSLWLGNGGSPEVFTDITCGITSRTFGMTADLREVTMPHAADVRLPAWTRRIIANHLAQFSGSGVFAEETWPTFRDWYLSGQPRNARIRLETTGGGYFSAAWLLTELGLPAQLDDGLVHSNVTLVNTKRLQWIYDVPPAGAGDTILYIFGNTLPSFAGGSTQPRPFSITGNTAGLFAGQAVGPAGSTQLLIAAGTTVQFIGRSTVARQLQISGTLTANFVSPATGLMQLAITGTATLAFSGAAIGTISGTFDVDGNTIAAFASPADWIDDLGETSWIDDLGETQWIDDNT